MIILFNKLRRKQTGSLDKGQNGFTIVELMIATVVFSMVLMVCSMAIVHVGRMYYKGMIVSRTQDTARKVVNDVAQAVQFGGSDVLVGSGDPLPLCIGQVRYTYTTLSSLGESPHQSHHVLWRDEGGNSNSNCEAVDDFDTENPDSPNDSGVEMLGANMRLPLFEVSRVGESDSYTIRVRVSYGEEEDFEEGSDYGICLGANAGGQFCAVSEITTTVQRRL